MVREGQSFLYPGLKENREITIEEVGSGEEGLGSLGEGQLRLSEAISMERGRGSKTTVDQLQDQIDPVEINRRRSEEARAADKGQDAPLTSNPLEWASDPSGLDFPGVDTGPTFRDENPEFDTDSFLDSL